MILCQIQAMLHRINDITTMHGLLEGMRRNCYGLFQETDLNFPEKKRHKRRTPLPVRKSVTAVLVWLLKLNAK